MRAVRIGLVVAALLAAGMGSRARGEAVPQPGFDRAIEAAKAEMLRDPAVAIQKAEVARQSATRMADADQRALCLVETEQVLVRRG